MVTEIMKSGITRHVCDVCGFAYKNREWAEKCQKWCTEHKSCNLEIARYALPMEEPAEVTQPE